MKVLWNDSLESGNPVIDKQHKELLEHMNSYFESLDKVYEHDVIVKTLNFLVKYVRFHFGTEEEMMKKYVYPEFRQHLEAHRKLVDELMLCYKKLIADGYSEEIVERLRVLLQVWFIDHIMGYDIKLAAYLKDNAK